MSYLVDTSWIVEHLRGNPAVTQRLSTLSDEGLAVSLLSVAELYEGVFRSSNPTRNAQDVRDFLNTVEVLGIEEPICIRFGREMAHLIQRGLSMGDIDLLIAVTALHHNLTLLTSDRDFERVEALQTLFY